jgi:hypothetical protein
VPKVFLRAVSGRRSGQPLVLAESNLGFPIGRPDAYGADNRITTAGFGYDAVGNLNVIPTGERYAYDAENRHVGHCTVDPSSCPTEPGAGRTQYGYDGEGRRVTKVSQSSGTIVFVYDARRRLMAGCGVGALEGSGNHPAGCTLRESRYRIVGKSETT